jgi:hypothetical protein
MDPHPVIVLQSLCRRHLVVAAVSKVRTTRRALREARLEEARAVQEFERFEQELAAASPPRKRKLWDE